MNTYEEFVAALEARPAGVSPLMWMAANHPALPPEASTWMLRWLRESPGEATAPPDPPEPTDTYTASFDNGGYEPDEFVHDESDPFLAVAKEFDGDMKDPGAYWAVRVTNDRTGESRLIDTESWTVVNERT